MAAVVVGTALSALAGESRATAAPSTDAVNDISRYCQACWRNARLPADRWGDCTQQVFLRLLERVDPTVWNRVLTDLESPERREFVLRALETAASGRGLADLPTLAKDLAGDDAGELADALDWIEALLRDAAVVAAGGGSPISADLASRLSKLGAALGPARASTLMLAAGRLREQLRLNLNRTLVAEAMLAAVAGGPDPS